MDDGQVGDGVLWNVGGQDQPELARVEAQTGKPECEIAHDVAVHIAFAKPSYLRRSDVPSDLVDAERKTVEEISRNEGKPDAALPKIIEGRLNGWFKERVLLEQPYVKDEKQSIEQFLNGATIEAFAQVVVGS